MQERIGENFKEGFLARLDKLQGADTLAVFAAKVGISLKTYEHYKSGRRKPTVMFVVSVAQRFGVTTDWLLGLAEQNGDRISPIPNGNDILQKAEAIMGCAEEMKIALGEKIAALKEVL